MQRKTLIAMLFVFALFLLTACQPAAPVSVTPSATPPAPTETPIPTPTPVEVAPGEFVPTSQIVGYEAPVEVIKLDKPMTTEYDPLNLDVMPSVPSSGEIVRNGQLGASVDLYLHEIGIINPDGSVNKPENVVAAKPDQWEIDVTPGSVDHEIPGGDMSLYPKMDNLSKVKDGPFQPTDLLFKVVDESGKVTGILVTELLYYEDSQGNIKVAPVFFFVDESLINKNNKSLLQQFFGHPEKGWDYYIAIPYIGVEAGQTGADNIHPLVNDKNAVLAEPMQTARMNFANQAVMDKDPSGIDRFWFAPLAWW